MRVEGLLLAFLAVNEVSAFLTPPPPPPRLRCRSSHKALRATRKTASHPPLPRTGPPIREFVVAAADQTRDLNLYDKQTRSSYIHFHGAPRLLTGQEEKELTKIVRKSVLWEQKRKDLAEVWGREPTKLEWLDSLSLGDGIGELEFQLLLREGEDAKERMIAANLALVITLAKKHSYDRSMKSRMPMSDIVQEGVFGLVRAIESFDPDRGHKFSTYAYNWVRAKILLAIKNQGRTIRLPCHIYDGVLRVMKAERELEIELDCTPTAYQIAERTRLTPDRVLFLKSKHGVEPTSIDGSLQVSVKGKMAQVWPDVVDDTVVASDTVMDRHMARGYLSTMLDRLDPREAQILKFRFGLETGRTESLQHVGEYFDLSRERVRQIERNALTRLRSITRQQKLDMGKELLQSNMLRKK